MNIVNTYTNYSNYNNKNLNNKHNFLPQKINYDTFTFMGNRGNTMSLYFQLHNKQYILKNQNETEFDDTIKAVTELSKGTDAENEKMKLDMLGQAYRNLSIQIQDDEKNNIDTMIYMFCSLLECLDSSDSVQASTDINYYLFEDFIPMFEDKKILKNTIREIISSDFLNKAVLKIRLQNLIK